jgi:N-acetylglucosamine-6-phosphate deacetylase
MHKAFSAARIFTGREWLYDRFLLVKDGTIESIGTERPDEHDYPLTELGPCWIIPGNIDLQVYGAAGKLLAVYPEAATVKLMRENFLQQGTLRFLPTIATNTKPVFEKCIDAVRSYIEAGGEGVPGIHLEGPWLDLVRRGAHVAEWVHQPSWNEVKDLLEYGKGVIRMITLAPEHISPEIIQLIKSYGIILSAGHSNADYDTCMKAFNDIPTVTHLYNAMSPLHHRAPGLVGAAFDHPQVRASIIPDGYHVDYAAISIAKRLMGERLFAITDAVTETTEGPYRHHLVGDKYECNGVLSGSALSMHQAMVNLVRNAGISLDESIRMCSLYPAELLNEQDKWGQIVPGCRAEFNVINEKLELQQVVTA